MDVFDDEDESTDSLDGVKEPLHKLLLDKFENSLNFYRIHLVTFTLVPFIFSGIMYACNTEYHIQYIDCLFCCVSAMTVTGLATIDLSQLSGWQQTILFIQMCMGSIVSVSLITILVRQHFFRQEFKHIIDARRELKRREQEERDNRDPGSPMRALRRLSHFSFAGRPDMQEQKEKAEESRPQVKEVRQGGVFGRFRGPHDKRPSSPEAGEGQSETSSPQFPPDKPVNATRASKGRKKFTGKLRTDMIKRVEGGGVGLVNPMGWYQSGSTPPKKLSAEPATQDTASAHSKDLHPLVIHQEAPRGVTGILDNPTPQSAPPAVSAAFHRGAEIGQYHNEGYPDALSPAEHASK